MTSQRKLLAEIRELISHTGRNTHIHYHFTAFAGSYLCEDLQDERLSDIPGQVPDIPEHREADWSLCQTGSSTQTKASNAASTICPLT